ncbi:MAG: hydroxyacid dehydrogenase, partial [Nitrospirota bacterium]
FIKLSGRDILTHAGKISHDKALEKAHAEYEQYLKERLNEPSPVERQFLEAVREMKQIEKKRKRGRRDGS